MIYLIEFIKGILIAFGVICGFLIFIGFILRKLETEAEDYEPENLIKPFEKYLQKVGEDEHYEQIKQVENIIFALKEGKIIDDVKLFKIKNETSLLLDDEDGKTGLRIVKKYIVIKKIEEMRL